MKAFMGYRKLGPGHQIGKNQTFTVASRCSGAQVNESTWKHIGGKKKSGNTFFKQKQNSGKLLYA